MQRPHEVVVFGATGFTGRLVAQSLHERYGAELRWAIAGRSAARLQAVSAALGGVPTLVADSADPASLDALCRQTAVVITTVGPYALYGEPLVAAAIRAGTHTTDLTGEPQFVRRLIDTHHQAAIDAGVRIVNCCGFDSIPSDLGTWVLQQAAVERHGAPCERVESIVWASKGAASGGTVASGVNMIAEAADPEVRRILGNPYSLCPEGERRGDDREQRSARYSDAAACWTAPWLMATINEKVVRRSNAVMGYPWGRAFSFNESLRVGGRLQATAIAIGMAAAPVALAIRPIRSLLQRTVLPAPGDGPTREQIDAGFFTLRLFGHRDGAPVVVEVHGKRDPGYGATAVMLSESGVCLARDPLDATGVLTPASAMGRHLVDRLNATGQVTFDVEPVAWGAGRQ